MAFSRLRGQKRYVDYAWAGRIADGNLGGGGDKGDGGCYWLVREDVSFLAGGQRRQVAIRRTRADDEFHW